MKLRIAWIGNAYYKHWIKVVRLVDVKRNGASVFGGARLVADDDGLYEVTPGDVVLRYGKIGGVPVVDVNRVTKTGGNEGDHLSFVVEYRGRYWSQAIRGIVAELLSVRGNPLAFYSVEELREELKRRGI